MNKLLSSQRCLPSLCVVVLHAHFIHTPGMNPVPSLGKTSGDEKMLRQTTRGITEMKTSQAFEGHSRHQGSLDLHRYVNHTLAQMHCQIVHAHTHVRIFQLL